MNIKTSELTIDKSTWPPGPWSSEPDKLQWQDTATGLACLIVRNSSSGNLCGYVGLPPGHTLHGVGYNNVDADVHGGLTYADACSGHICHIPEPGQPDDVWWLGFDCGHLHDLSPNYSFSVGGTYRDIEYVKDECRLLASQLASS